MSPLGADFFVKSQRKLLWLLNHPVHKHWFRHVLCIDGAKSSVGKNKIIGITPNSIWWWNDDYSVRAEFRTHPKFSKRLYYAFKPVWWAAHSWDMKYANRFIPAWNLGFDTLPTKYPGEGAGTTCDGVVARTGANEAWSSLIAGAGNWHSETATTSWILYILSSATSNQWERLQRGIYTFDTDINDPSATIDSGTFTVTSNGKGDSFTTDINPSLNLYGATPSNPGDLANSDYGQCGSTPYSTTKGYSSWPTDGNGAAYTLNADGRAAVNLDGISKFSLRDSVYDVSGTPPAWESAKYTYMAGYWADYAGTTNDPKLDVTYTPGVSLDQEGFRWRDDDGSESGASWLASQDSNITRAINTNTRLRFLINATGDPASKQFQLEWRKQGGTWRKAE